MYAFVLAVVFIIILIYLLFERNELDVLPGPGRMEFFLLTLNLQPENLFTTIGEFTRQYGDRYIFKLFQRKRVLHLSRPEDIETILSHTKNITKSLPYEFVKPWLGTGLLLNTGVSWHKRRKMMTPTFHFNILRNFATVMEEKSKDLVETLMKKNGEEVDIAPVISDFTLFTICETAMGTKLDSDRSTATLLYKDAIYKIGNVLLSRLFKLWLHNDYIFYLTRGKHFKILLDIVLSFSDKVIIEKKKKLEDNKKGVLNVERDVITVEENNIINGKDDITVEKDNFTNKTASSIVEKDVESVKFVTNEDVGTKKRLAMLDLLLEAESKGQIDLTGVRDEVNTFMFAGHDTTAMALTFCFMLLADHDDVQDRIHEEIDQILGSSDKSPTISNLAEMKYLDAVIKETMRLYPSVPYIGRDITEEFMMGDIPIKKGTEISVHIYDLHHRADIYPQPEEFRPERFLNGEMRHPYAYIPFSAGPRNCIGQKFALQEMKLVITEVCRNFILEPKVKGFRPLLKVDMILRPAEPIYVKFIPRTR